MKLNRTLGAVALAVGSLIGSANLASASTIIAKQDFDGGAVNQISSTNSVDMSTAPAGDMFGVGSRSSLLPNGVGLPFAISDDSVTGATGNNAFPSDVQGIVGQAKTDNFFGVTDTVNGVFPGDSGTATWAFDISSAGLLPLSISIDIAAMGDFELADLFSFEYSIDGSAFTSLFTIAVDESLAHTYRAMDSGATPSQNDPLLLDGTILDKSNPVTGAFDTFTKSIVGNGGVLTLRFSATTDGGTEAFGFDNIVITAASPQVVPEPSSIALMGLGIFSAGVYAAKRRRRTA